LVSEICFPHSLFFETSLLRRSPTEIQVHEKYSPRARACSFLLDPGGPTKNIRLAKDEQKRTLGFEEVLNEEIKGLFRPIDDEQLGEVVEELRHLVLFQVTLD
jgi:hypothetical protein